MNEIDIYTQNNNYGRWKTNEFFQKKPSPFIYLIFLLGLLYIYIVSISHTH